MATLAVTQQGYGGPEVLSLAGVRTPTPQPGEVLLRVRAASVNARDWHIMRGEPRLARLADRGTFGLRGPRIALRGTDVADQLATVPINVTSTQAGAVPLAGATAQLCIDAAAPAPGSSILINGASGGVGTYTPSGSRRPESQRSRRGRGGPIGVLDGASVRRVG